MIVVVVGEQDVGDPQAEALDRLVDRPRRAAGVDQDRVAAGPVADDVAVRQPAVRHAPLEDHQLKVSTERNAVLPLHQLEGVVDVVERHAMGDERVEVELAVEVQVDELGNAVAALGAAERGAGDRGGR